MNAIDRELKKLTVPFEDITIIEGGARGADALAKDLAGFHGIKVEEYRADWDRHGRGAGPMRNQQMLETKPDMVWAFHENLEGSKGTKDMVQRATKAGVPVRVFSS